MHPVSRRPSGADRLLLTMAEALSGVHEVDLVSMGHLDLNQAAAFFGLDLSRVRLRATWEHAGPLLRGMDVLLSRCDEGNRYRKMYSCRRVSRISADYDLFINGESGDVAVNLARRGIFYTFFPWRDEALAECRGGLHALYLIPYRLWHRRVPPRGQFSYDRMVTLSEYSRFFIRSWWGKEAALLPPCVDTARFRPGRKERIILTVGRFFRGHGHEKRFEVLCREFREMSAHPAVQGWRLHVAGFAENADYVAELQRSFEGSGVVLHPNMPADALEALYGQAELYWHGAGFGQDLNARPETAEHFGIPVVEAMAAGAIPLVFDAGGPAELVDRGRYGLAWRSPDELSAMTIRLCGDPGERDRLRAAGVRRAADFSPGVFRRDLLRLVDEVSR